MIFFIFRGFLGLLGEFVIEIRYNLVLKSKIKIVIKFYDNYNLMNIKYYIERKNLLIILILMVVVSLFFLLDKCILYLFELDFFVVLLNSLIFVGVFLKFIRLFCDRGFLFY